MSVLYVCDVCKRQFISSEAIQRLEIHFPHLFRNILHKEKIYIDVCINCAENFLFITDNFIRSKT